MFKSQIFFNFVIKKVKIFWLFDFSGFTFDKNKQISKNKKIKKSTLIDFFTYFKQKSQPKNSNNLVPNGALIYTNTHI